jgi:hypothetical protein
MGGGWGKGRVLDKGRVVDSRCRDERRVCCPCTTFMKAWNHGRNWMQHATIMVLAPIAASQAHGMRHKGRAMAHQHCQLEQIGRQLGLSPGAA